ncbi:MAG: hypothetical protein HY507_00295 [Candidatus Zambryskibacteria bacterium]|nr:hypothetical protein [Candidatus Zambryskibacteria bacterium]
MHKIFSHTRNYLRWYILLSLLTLNIVLWSAVFREDRQGILTFAVLNVGQGDALFIESPTGTQVLIDGGPGNSLMKEISKIMPWYDRHIDMLVVTNPDKDHYEGFIPLMNKYSIDVVLESGTQSKVETYAVLEKEIAGKKISRVLAQRGQIIDLGGGAYLQILFPDRDVSLLSSNDGSIVMKLVYGNTSIALQGDSTARIEHYLVGLGGDLKRSILKVGHHGSRTSTTEEYVKAVAPKWAVISSGINNNYGHPHKEVLDTLNKFEVPILDTCAMGRIILHSDGKEFTLENKNIAETLVGCRK